MEKRLLILFTADAPLGNCTIKITVLPLPWPTVEKLLSMCSSSCLPGGGSNTELALHCLHLCHGDTVVIRIAFCPHVLLL